jgi:hypothetical protein
MRRHLHVPVVRVQIAVLLLVALVATSTFLLPTAHAVAPTISSVTLSSGAVGQSVEIAGSGFQSTTSVKFNGVAASSFTVTNDARLNAVVASGATTGKITVTTTGGSATSATNFTVTNPPVAPKISGNPENTSGRFHYGQVSMSSIANPQDLLNAKPPVKMAWNWNSSRHARDYSSIHAGRYVPGDRQPSLTWYQPYGARPLPWFQTNHPNWIEYICDRSTIAYAFGDKTAIPLDITNSAVRTFLIGIYTNLLKADGYDALDVDNFTFNNTGSWTGQRCGHWTGAQGSSTWVPQFTARSNDRNYRAAWINWAGYLQKWVHTNWPNVALAGNFSYDFNFGADSATLERKFDIIFDEKGFNHGNTSTPAPYTDSQWIAKISDLQAYLSSGHGLHSVNQWLERFANETDAQLYWVIANTLLLNNGATWGQSSGQQEYGKLLISPLYAAASVGSARGAFYQESSGAFRRDFSSGIVLVNSSSKAT